MNPVNIEHRTSNAEHRKERGGRQCRTAGFSLIEVIVAILILGIALVALTEGITTGLDSSKESELQTTAALLAAGQIETLRAEGDYTDGDTEGDFGESLALYRWKQTVSPAELDGLHDVTITVENARTGKSIYELKTMLFEPPENSSLTETNRRSVSGAQSGRRRGR